MSGSEAPAAHALQGVPQHIHSLLDRLHAESKTQESAIIKDEIQETTFDDVMRDKFIALDQDKAHFVYQVCRAINAKTIVEAGTSFGVSTIYLALAAAANVAATGEKAHVIATENEPSKAARARQNWKECGATVEEVIQLREGDLRQTLKTDLENVDFLLLDIWTPMALPTLKIVQPKMRHGAVIIADNTVASAEKYKDLFDYIRAPENGFITSTLPFSGGLEMSVYLPQM